MSHKCERIVVLGAGQMGAGAAAVFAQEVQVTLLNRAPISKAQRGVEVAVDLARTNTIRERVSPGTLEEDFKSVVAQADLILDTLGEDLDLKRQFFQLVDQYRTPGSIVATGSSGLSVARLCQGRTEDFRKHFLAIHLFNPPTYLVAVELVRGPDTLQTVMDYVADIMANRFRRIVVRTEDKPGYAGNRIAIRLINEVVQLVPEHGVELLDYLLGPWTGRLSTPLATVDLIGWDIYVGLADNLYRNSNDEAREFFRVPDFMNGLLAQGVLGDKTPEKGGFYKKTCGKTHVLDLESGEYVPPRGPKLEFIEKMKRLNRYGAYSRALWCVMEGKGTEVALARRALLGMISYAGMRNGEVSNMEGINRVLGWGYNWLPPDAAVDLIGLAETKDLLRLEGFPVPAHLAGHRGGRLYAEVDDVGRYLAGG